VLAVAVAVAPTAGIRRSSPNTAGRLALEPASAPTGSALLLATGSVIFVDRAVGRAM
jgi:hypothetical protein